MRRRDLLGVCIVVAGAATTLFGLGLVGAALLVAATVPLSTA